MATAKVLDTQRLTRLGRDAVATDKNRAPSDRFFDEVDPDGSHVVSFSMIHNDSEVRALILCKMQGSNDPVELWLDMEMSEFLDIPEVTHTR